MSRSDPFKKKRRSAKETFLLCGEGDREVFFLRHIRKLYSSENDVAVKIINANGGSVPNMVNYASRLLGEYSRRILVCDSDKPVKEMTKAREIAINQEIVLVANSPCVESLFLSILGKNCDNLTSNQCKRKFESEILMNRRSDSVVEYEKIFTKTLLNTKRHQIENLDKIIQIVENGGTGFRERSPIRS